MKDLLVIDACMREESRTRRILNRILDSLNGKCNISFIALSDVQMPALNARLLEERNNGIVPEWAVEYAKRIAGADLIIIAAPFWDMGIPAMLKVFIENVSLYGITFEDNGKSCIGLCKCKHLIYITTRGMNIKTGGTLEQASPYLKALSALWSLGEVHTVAAENLDYSTQEEVERKLEKAAAQGIELCRQLL